MNAVRTMPARFWRAFTRSPAVATFATCCAVLIAWAAFGAALAGVDTWLVVLLAIAAVACLIITAAADYGDDDREGEGA